MDHKKIFQGNLTHEFDSVYVIESLPAGELKTGTALYDDVVGPMAFGHRIHTRFFSAHSKQEFLSQLSTIREEVVGNNYSPILHFDAHGSPDGLGLADKDNIAWGEVRDVLAEINVASQFNLLVVLAACSGIYLQKVVLPDRAAPLWGLIGPTNIVSAGEIQSRFQGFYREYIETLDPTRAMEALNDAPLGTSWTYGFRSAVNLFREAWAQYTIGFLDPTVARERFDDFIAASPALMNADESTQHRIIRHTLMENDFFLERFASRFFMYDTFPENISRFPIDQKALVWEVLNEWQES